MLKYSKETKQAASNLDDMIYRACSRALATKSLNNHCSQACLCGIAPYIGLEECDALRLMAALGGGMRHGQLCGAVTAAGVALGYEFGAGSIRKNEEEVKNDERLGELTVEFVDRFKEVLKTTVCDEILNNDSEPFNWEMPADMHFTGNSDNENGNEFNIKVPACGVSITAAVRITMDIIDRERKLKKSSDQ